VHPEKFLRIGPDPYLTSPLLQNPGGATALMSDHGRPHIGANGVC